MDLINKLGLTGVKEHLPEVKNAVLSKLSGNSAWFTPWSWADDGRTYYGDDGFWFYGQIPYTSLDASNRTLNTFINDLFKELGGQKIHILLHGQTAPVELPKDLPGKLGTLLADLSTHYSTTNTLSIGVALTPEREKVKKTKIEAFKDTINDSIDNLLGEDVPDFSLVAKQREKAVAVFARYGGGALSGANIANVEAWYLLGGSSDPVVTEEETLIYFTGMSTLVLASLADITNSAEERHVPAPSTEQSGTCLSIRGTLASGELKDTSVVCARRAVLASGWIRELEKAFPEVSVQALPLRQLPALNETLPCSSVSMARQGADLPLSQLTACGLSDSLRLGDRRGLQLGLSGSQYTELTWWDPFATPAETLTIVGGNGSGKTFLAEYLAVQAVAAGITVTYLSGDSESGRPLVEQHGTTPIIAQSPGIMHLPYLPAEARNNKELVKLLSYITPEITPQEWEKTLSAVDWNDHGRTVPTTKLHEFVADPQLAARLLRANRDNANYTMFSIPMSDANDSATLAVPRILASFPEKHRRAASDLIVAAAVLRGGIVIADGCPAGQLTTWALKKAEESGVAVALISTFTQCPQEYTTSTVSIIGAQEDTQLATAQLRWVGEKSTAYRREWLAESGPVLEDGGVRISPSFVIRDRHGRLSPLTLAPVPESLLGQLSRGKATRYL
jgi:hypothetical protein